MNISTRMAPRRRGSLDRWLRWPTNYFLTLINLIAIGAVPVSLVGAAIWAEKNGWGVFNVIHLPLLVASRRR